MSNKGIIVCIGDMLKDVDVFCSKVKERDGYPCLKPERIEERSGGIGAVANMVLGLGYPVHTICDPDYVSTKTRTIVDGKVICRVDKDVTARSFNAQLHYADIVLVADYGKGFLNEPLWKKIVSYYTIKGAKEIIVDPHPSRPLSFYEGATAFKFSEEYEETQISHIRDAKKRIAIGTTNIVTWGRYGLGLCLPGETIPFQAFKHSEYDRPSYRAVDLCGAGDAVLAMLGVCRLQGMTWQESCQQAAEYAAKVCQVWGARHPVELMESAVPA